MTRVGYKLYRQVRDLAPADWTSGERLVAWVIADDANDETRRSFLAPDEVAKRAGMTEDGVRKCLGKLAKKGFEFRVSLGKGSDGRDVYSLRGMPPQYVVPDVFQLMIDASAVSLGLVDNGHWKAGPASRLTRLSTG